MYKVHLVHAGKYFDPGAGLPSRPTQAETPSDPIEPASANEPLWDGARIDHGAVIDALVDVEHAEAIQGWS